MSETVSEVPSSMPEAPPAGYTEVGTNTGPQTTLYAKFVQTGRATIMYSAGPGKHPDQVLIVHQDSKKTAVEEGTHEYAVHAGDTIYVFGAGAACKLVWYYL